MTTTAISFAILDVPFRVVGTLDDLAYIHAFVDAYDDAASVLERSPVQVSVERTAVPPTPTTATSCWVHRSANHYWDVRATEYARHSVDWHSRPVRTRYIPDDDRLVVITPPIVDPAVTGEAAWHVCRNLALYRRNPNNAKLLHASAVSLHNSAVLFLGAESAGKTTLLTEAVITHGADPLANDRVLVELDTPLTVTSWPSHASYTEGTLLDYDSLRQAALDYENGCFPYRTQTWGSTITPQYTKRAKRIYPMHWFTAASSHQYRRHAPLGALVLSHLSPDITTPRITRISLDHDGERKRLITLLRRECFDTHEPAFCPWHGLPLPQVPADAATLVTALANRDIPVYRFAAPAPGFRSAFDDLLSMLF